MEFAWWGAYPRTRTIRLKDYLARVGMHQHSTANVQVKPVILVAKQLVKLVPVSTQRLV